MPGSAAAIRLQALAPSATAHAGEGDPPANSRRPLVGPPDCPPLLTEAAHSGHFIRPPRSSSLERTGSPPVRQTPGPTSVLLYWGRFSAQRALAVVFCSLHTMPARHGGPRVHSNNASRGAGRACAGLGHCGSLRARGACFAPELCFPKRLHHSVVGGWLDLGVPIGFQHFPAPGFLEEVKTLLPTYAL